MSDFVQFGARILGILLIGVGAGFVWHVIRTAGKEVTIRAKADVIESGSAKQKIEEIRELAELPTDASNRLAIMEAYKFLDFLFKQLDFDGEKMIDRLRVAIRYKQELTHLEWLYKAAHEAHANPARIFTHKEAMRGYKDMVRALEVMKIV